MKLTILSLIALLSVLQPSYAGENSKSYGTTGGRFQLVQLGDQARFQYLVDTQTGKMWRGVCGHNKPSGECDYSVWTVEEIEGITVTRQQIFKTNAALDGDAQSGSAQ
jgi:hypothetical protein